MQRMAYEKQHGWTCGGVKRWQKRQRVAGWMGRMRGHPAIDGGWWASRLNAARAIKRRGCYSGRCKLRMSGNDRMKQV